MSKKTLIASLILHISLLGLILIDLPSKKAVKNQVAIEAKLMFKKKARPEHWLPEKMPPPVAKVKAPVVVKDLKPAAAPQKEAVLPAKEKVLAPKKKVDYMKELARLSRAFSDELDDATDAKEVFEVEADGSYFDQIYSLIKQSFVLPPHVNSPRGRSLQAVLRLYLSPDGNLSRLSLERSSGDEHFDKAVMEGTKRVNNFGAVPIMLQSALSQDGVVVEMCPFKCLERRDG